ncbi:MAG: amidohydrolase family protein [Clostridiales Family XIII bacterium]|nr:amidohydrolase family protein [Clostridiales Family XIII bacterium]
MMASNAAHIQNAVIWKQDVSLSRETAGCTALIFWINISRKNGILTLDGAAFEHTMACFTPYTDRPELRGMLYHSDEEVYDFISKAHARSMQCTMHAVGERAIEQLLYTYLRVFSEQGRKDIRHRLEHFCLPTDEQIQMAKELDIILSMQPSFSYFWDGAGQEFANVVGRKRADRMDPFHKIIEKGITVLSGSDAPVAPIQPLTYLAHCVSGYNQVRNISVTEAIKMCTVNAAYANGEEKQKGSLEVGKTADMAVISKDPYEAAAAGEILEMEVLATIKDGRIIYRKEPV